MHSCISLWPAARGQFSCLKISKAESWSGTVPSSEKTWHFTGQQFSRKHWPKSDCLWYKCRNIRRIIPIWGVGDLRKGKKTYPKSKAIQKAQENSNLKKNWRNYSNFLSGALHIPLQQKNSSVCEALTFIGLEKFSSGLMDFWNIKSRFTATTRDKGNNATHAEFIVPPNT